MVFSAFSLLNGRLDVNDFSKQVGQFPFFDAAGLPGPLCEVGFGLQVIADLSQRGVHCAGTSDQILAHAVEPVDLIYDHLLDFIDDAAFEAPFFQQFKDPGIASFNGPSHAPAFIRLQLL